MQHTKMRRGNKVHMVWLSGKIDATPIRFRVRPKGYDWSDERDRVSGTYITAKGMPIIATFFGCC